MMAIVMLVVLAMAASAWVAFAVGRVTSDRRINMNHHQMMMLLMEIRTKDDAFPILSADDRNELSRLLGGYTHLSLDRGE